MFVSRVSFKKKNDARRSSFPIRFDRLEQSLPGTPDTSTDSVRFYSPFVPSRDMTQESGPEEDLFGSQNAPSFGEDLVEPPGNSLSLSQESKDPDDAAGEDEEGEAQQMPEFKEAVKQSLLTEHKEHLDRCVEKALVDATIKESTVAFVVEQQKVLSKMEQKKQATSRGSSSSSSIPLMMEMEIESSQETEAVKVVETENKNPSTAGKKFGAPLKRKRFVDGEEEL
jgi:hypothetical protein